MTIFKNLAKLVSYDAIEKVPGKSPLIQIEYTRPDYYDSAKKFTVSQWESKLDKEILGRILDLSEGSTFCIHVEKNEKGSLSLKDVRDAADAPEKTQQKSRYGGKGGYSKVNDTGAQVGNALNVAAITLGAGATLEAIEERAKGILEVGERLKKVLLASQGSTAEVKPVSEFEKLKKEREEKKTKTSKKESSALEEINDAETDLVDDDMEDWEE